MTFEFTCIFSRWLFGCSWSLQGWYYRYFCLNIEAHLLFIGIKKQLTSYDKRTRPH